MSDWPLSADDIWDLYVLAERYELSPTYRSILGVFIEAILPAEPHKHPGWWEEPLSAMEMMEASTTKMKLHIVAHKLHLGRLWTSLLIGPKYKSSVGATIKQMEEYFDTVTSIMLVIRTAELHGSADGGVVVKYTRGNELYLVSSADEGKILHHF